MSSKHVAGTGSGAHGLGQLTMVVGRWTSDAKRPKFGCRAILGCLVLIPCVMACPKLICFGLCACFNPIEPEHVL